MDYTKFIDRYIKIKSQKIAWEQQCVRINLQKLSYEQQCIRMRSQELTYNQQEENLRALKLRNSLLESQVEYNRKMTSALYDQFAREMESAAANRNEERDTAMMRQLIEMQNKALQAILSRDAPIEVKNIFPEPVGNHALYGVIPQLFEADTYSADSEIM